MAVTSKMFGKSLMKALSKEVDFLNDTIKVSLHTNALVPSQDIMDYYNDINNEVVGAGYTAGGATLAGKTMTYDTVSNTIKLDADDVAWAASSITARYAVIYVDTGVSTTSVVLGYVDFGEDLTSDTTEFKITWNANGIFAITVA